LISETIEDKWSIWKIKDSIFDNISLVTSIDVWLWKTFIWLFSSVLYLVYFNNKVLTKLLNYLKDDKTEQIEIAYNYFNTRKIEIISNKAILQ